ncbi:MAG: MMPL family transporter [Methanomethylophilus sp.]
MLFDRIANFISKHAKAIILVWIIVLICSIWPASHASEVLDYSVSGMSGSNAESVQGGEIVSEYFYNDGISMDSVQLLVVEFTDSNGAAAAAELGTALYAYFITDGSYTDDSGNAKVTTFLSTGTYTNEDGGGAILYAIGYNPDYAGAVYQDTGNLRSVIADQERTLTDSSGLTTYVTGTGAISYDMEQGATDDIAKIDPFSILLVLLLVGLFFRSLVSSAMPPLTIGAAFGTVLCILYFLGQAINVFYITEMLILVSMLGAGCDYCIFILARYREERRNGQDHATAVHRAIVWAGESITTSGLAVIIGFGAMSICSFEMISTMGIILAIGIAMALLAALTLMSSILSVVGDKLFWPSNDPNGEYLRHGWFKQAGNLGRRYFERSAHFSIKHAKAIVIAAVLFTVPMGYIYATADSSYDMVGALSNGEAAQGLTAAEEYIDGGVIMPDYVVLEMNDPIATADTKTVTFNGSSQSVFIGSLAWSDTDALTSLKTLSADIGAADADNIGSVSQFVPWSVIEMNAVAAGATTEDEVVSYFVSQAGTSGIAIESYTQLLKDNAVILTTYCWPDYAYELGNARLASVYDWLMFYYGASLGGTADGPVSTTIGTATVTTAASTLDYAKITVVTVEQGMSDRSIETVGTVTDVVSSYAADDDLISQTWITGSPAAMFEISEQVNQEFSKVEILAVALIIILLFFVMRSYLTPFRSVLTIMMSVIWTVAITHLLFNNLLGYGVVWMIPIILLVVCLGLGMDYDILLTTRIKENHLYRGMDNDTAIQHAICKSGAIITICGLIMGGAFGTLMLSSTEMLQEFGFALMFAILVDALLVRTYIVPAVMHLMGEWSWKGPKFMHRHDKHPVSDKKE